MVNLRQFLQLISSKCIPILLYGLEGLPMQKYQLNSLDFVINRFFMKLFKTSNIRRRHRVVVEDRSVAPV